MSRKILIVEDEAAIADICQAEMEKNGAEVTVVENGKRALEVVQKQKFDLVLLDLLMPVMDGYAVLAHCKKTGKSMPIIVVLTNLGQDMTKAQCKELGAVDFIVKSDVDAPDIWEKIKKYLPVK